MNNVAQAAVAALEKHHEAILAVSDDFTDMIPYEVLLFFTGKAYRSITTLDSYSLKHALAVAQCELEDEAIKDEVDGTSEYYDNLMEAIGDITDARRALKAAGKERKG